MPADLDYVRCLGCQRVMHGKVIPDDCPHCGDTLTEASRDEWEAYARPEGQDPLL